MGGHASARSRRGIAVEEMAEFFRLTGAGRGGDLAVQARPGAQLRREPPPHRREARERPHLRARPDRREATRDGHDARRRDVPAGRRDASSSATSATAACTCYRAGQLQPAHRGPLAPQRLPADSASSRPRRSEAFPHKNVIVRALGMKAGGRGGPRAGGAAGRRRRAALLATGSPGWSPTSRSATSSAASHGDLRRAAQTLVDAANRAGGVDNITCVLVAVSR